MNIFIRLRDYYQKIADSMSSEKEGSNIFANMSDRGISREDILKDFLKKHLPLRCDVIKGGFIFDANGKESNQIDLIITNDLTLQFRQYDDFNSNGKSFNYIEGCYAAISVKSLLNKDGLIDSLNNLASIPNMPDIKAKINPSLKLANTMDIEAMPLKIVFAFTGIEMTTIQEYMEEYYSKNNIPKSRRVNIIVVNNRYIIVNVGKSGGITNDGMKLQPDTYFGFGINNKYIGGYSLFYILAEIQNYSNIGSHFIMNFNEIFSKIPFYE